MFVPYQVDVPMERWPYANWVLIGLTTLISLAALMGGGEAGGFTWMVLSVEQFHL